MAEIADIFKLKVDPYINIIVIGDIKILNSFFTHIKDCRQHELLNLFSKSYEMSSRKITCNLWKANLNTNNNQRHFFSKKIDYCLILCPLKSQNKENLIESIAMAENLAEYTVVGIEQRIDELSEFISSKNINLAKIKGYDTEQINKLLLLIVNTIYQHKKQELNQKFREILAKLSD